MNYIVSIIVGAALGLFGGYALFSKPADTAMDHMDGGAMAMDAGMAMDSHDMGHMEHEPIVIDPTLPIPAVSVEATADTMGGYNIQVTPTNFTFTPKQAGQAAVANEGHAHVYVNDVKVGRLYGEWMYIDKKYFTDGPDTNMVTLNANDHSEWEQNGNHIAAMVEVE